ncbi:MAG: hypothetical protein E7319_07335 [Clostridiales bacterium]|nr:hypothetical protein [Clostridiales bacterium]
MNCPNCGNVVTPGTPYCPLCNAALQQGNAYPPQQQWQQGYVPQQGYMQTQGYIPQQDYAAQSVQDPTMGAYAGYAQPTQPAQPYAGYQQQGYPTGYQQQNYPVYGQPRQPSIGAQLMGVLSQLPRLFVESFLRPADTLRGLVERGDVFSCPIVVAVVLVVTFLGGMTVMRGLVGQLLSLISMLTGVSLAMDRSAMNQGINYLAGQVAPGAGGIAVLCQVLAMLIPVAVALVYAYGICKAPFSWNVVLGMITVTTLPTVAVALVTMLLSLLSPWLAVVAMLCGMAIAYIQLGSMMCLVTGRSEAQMLPVKMICIPISLFLTLVIVGLVGSAMAGGLLQRMLQLLGGAGSLI